MKVQVDNFALENASGNKVWIDIDFSDIKDVLESFGVKTIIQELGEQVLLDEMEYHTIIENVGGDELIQHISFGTVVEHFKQEMFDYVQAEKFRKLIKED